MIIQTLREMLSAANHVQETRDLLKLLPGDPSDVEAALKRAQVHIFDACRELNKLNRRRNEDGTILTGT